MFEQENLEKYWVLSVNNYDIFFEMMFKMIVNFIDTLALKTLI